MRLDPIPGQTNTRFLDLAEKADGDPITGGTVNYYLYAVTGANAGKWFKHSDQTWNAAETVCMAMTHVADGHWKAADVHTDAWADGIEYLEYAKESGGLHVAISNTFRCDTLLWQKDVSEGDIFIDITTTPWQWTLRKKGTTDALVGPKNLYQPDGSNVTSADHLVGRHTEPA